jgi:hypothetical protein
LKKMSFLSELQPEIVSFIRIMTSCNIPGGSLKIIYQIRSKGFLVIKTLYPPLFIGYQKIVHLFDKNGHPYYEIKG